jgi:hypothetical protein
LIAYPFEEMKRLLPDMNIERMRTSEKRKGFLKLITPFLADATNWDELFDNLIETKKNK